jgi:hypothetical protein
MSWLCVVNNADTFRVCQTTGIKQWACAIKNVVSPTARTLWLCLMCYAVLCSYESWDEAVGQSSSQGVLTNIYRFRNPWNIAVLTRIAFYKQNNIIYIFLLLIQYGRVKKRMNILSVTRPTCYYLPALCLCFQFFSSLVNCTKIFKDKFCHLCLLK